MFLEESEIAQVAKESLEKHMKHQEGFKKIEYSLLIPIITNFLRSLCGKRKLMSQKNFPTTYQQAKVGAQQHLTADPIAETYQVRYFE